MKIYSPVVSSIYSESLTFSLLCCAFSTNAIHFLCLTLRAGGAVGSGAGGEGAGGAGASAQSLKCDQCGAILKDVTAAELHAHKV